MTTVKRNPLGPTGETVRMNVKWLREDQNLGYSQLSRKLGDIGRPIPDLGLRRIEAGERRVDADDLVALAVALDVSPVTLLMPPVADSTKMVEVPGGGITADRLWKWLVADRPLPGYKGSYRHNLRFFADARPEWDASPWKTSTTRTRPRTGDVF